MHLRAFLFSALRAATSGDRRYHIWMGSLTAIMLLGGVLGVGLLDGIVRPNMRVVAAERVRGSLRRRVLGVHGVGRVALHHHIMWEFPAAS